MNQEQINPASQPFSAVDLSHSILGQGALEILLSTREENRQMASALLTQAQRSLEIFTPDLEPAIYDEPAFLEGIKRLVLRSSHVRIRILLQDPSTVIRDGHRLVELMRRLSSFIEIREPHTDYHEHNEAFLIADQCGLIHRRIANRYEGRASFNDALQARGLVNFFNEIWQRSQPYAELRRIHI